MKHNVTLSQKMSIFDGLDKLIDSHEACENAFFARARCGAWNTSQLRLFAPDYYCWIKSFPEILAGLAANVRDEDSRFFLTQILFSELGSGNDARMHFKLFGRTLNALGLSDSEINSGPRFAETRALIEGMTRLYVDKNLSRAMGAQYALEKQAFPMIDKLYKGFKHYPNLNRDNFEYFELHLVEEPEHLACMQKCVARYLSSPSGIEVVKAGAVECLDLIAAFWRRLYQETSTLEN